MNKRNYKSKIKITICVAIVIAFLGVSYIVKLYYPHDYGTTTGNFMNGQKMVEMDGDLYFFSRDDEDGGLYKMDKEGEVFKIADETELCLNAIGDYLYFKKWYGVEKDTQIIKMKKDGSERQVLFEGDIGLNFIVVDDKMYFSYTPDDGESESVYSLTTDGEDLKKTQLSQYALLQLLLNPQMSEKDADISGMGYSTSEIQIRGEYIYLYQIQSGLDYDKLYRVKKKGTEAKFLADRVIAFNVAEDDYVYYVQLNENESSVTISKMSIETLKSESLIEMEIGENEFLWLDVAADKIYIAAQNTGGYFLDTDGTNLVKVSDLVSQIED